VIVTDGEEVPGMSAMRSAAPVTLITEGVYVLGPGD
jgi:hypothetical protein